MTKRQFTVERLPRPEHYGDWHDKPCRWVAKCESDPCFTQKFSTKKNAITWARIAKTAATFNDAQADYQFV